MIALFFIVGQSLGTLFNRDFPYGFFFTTSMNHFGDFLPAPQICKFIFSSVPGFSAAWRSICGPLLSEKTKRVRSNSLLVYDNSKVFCFNSKVLWLKNNGISGGGKVFCHKRQLLCLNSKILWNNSKALCSSSQSLSDNSKGRRPGLNVLLQLERPLDQLEKPLRQLERPFHQLESLF